MSKDLGIRLLADRVLIKSEEAETKTKSGIIIPDGAKEKPAKGIVMAVGIGKRGEPLSVKVGDKVMYGKYAGSDIEHNGETYLIMRESDCMAIIKD